MAELIIRRGQSVRWKLNLEYDGEPVEIDGATWEILESTSTPDPTFTVTNGATGESEITFTPEQTLTMEVGKKSVRVRLILSNGEAHAPEPLIFRVK